MNVSFHDFISRKPKPIVFGFFGVFGGIIGAILLGEPVWALLKPPAPPPPKPRLVMTVSPSVEIFQGSENTITVQIARDLFDNAVQVDLVKAPPGVTSTGLTVGSGETEGTLKIEASSNAVVGSGKLIVSAKASSNSTKMRVDNDLSINVIENTPTSVDVMFVVDTTGSMGYAIEGVREGIVRFTNGLVDNGIDFRVGLAAFRDERIGEPTQVLTFDGAAFTTNATEFRRQVSTLEATGGGDGPESSLDGLLIAATQRFRPEVIRVLILITDAPPAIPDKETRSMVDAIDSLKSHGLEQLHLVVNPDQKAIYEQLREASPGQYFNLQSVSSGGTAFASLMPRLSKAIAKASARPDQEANLSELPPAPIIKSVQSTSQFDPKKKGQLVLAIACWTGCIAAIISLFLSGGQSYFLKASLPPLASVATGLAGGLMAGLVGGAVGQGLFFLTPDLPIMESLFRILGWTLLGSLAGFGLSFFIPNMQVQTGLIGGGIGGFIGAIGYLTAIQIGPGGDITGRILGAIILGFFIGLLIAIAESSFRSAWLEVWRGPKEMITVTLGPEPIRIGSDNQKSTVWAPDVPAVALKYWIRDGKVICFDSEKQQELIVSNGDQRNLGLVNLIVRTGQDNHTTNTPSTGAPPPPPPPPPPRSVVKTVEKQVAPTRVHQAGNMKSNPKEMRTPPPPPPPPPPPTTR